MKFKGIISLLIGFVLMCLAYQAFAGDWVRMEQSFDSLPRIIRPGMPDLPFLYVADDHSVFKSTNNGKTWERSLRLSLGGNVNRLEIVPGNPAALFVCTTEGLYKSSDEGKNWSRIYSGIQNAKNVTSFAAHPFEKEVYYIGTADGVFLTKDSGKTWSRAFAELSRKNIQDIQIDEDNREIYFAANLEIFRYHMIQDSFRKVYSHSFSVFEDEQTEIENSQNKTLSSMRVLIMPGADFQIAVMTPGGIATSNDEGETWQELSREGLRSSGLIDLVYSKKAKTFFAASENGIFEYDIQNKRWKNAYEGLGSSQISGIAIERETERLIVATERGVFIREIVPLHARAQLSMDGVNLSDSNSLLHLEPGISEIQRQAIKYADVGNSKIKRWHFESRLRALIPDLTVSKGFDISNDVHVDTGSTTTPDIFVQGPDDRGRSTDVSLKWSLGDLIFNSSQTSIDSREKSMVELRDQILNEVTRLYFERRRAQLDFLANPPADPSERLKAILRIEELTANVDSLTNGYLSKRLDFLSQQNPKLTELWNKTTEKSII